MKLRNLTPHDIVLFDPSGTRALATLAREDMPAPRIDVSTQTVGAVTSEGASWPLTESSFGEVHGLPEVESDVLIVVSQLVCEALPDRDDLVFPAGLVRDKQGRIIGCRAVSRARR